MSYRIKLKDTRSGYSKWIEFNYEYSDYLWIEGNYECDCNRSLFLYDRDESKELTCNLGENVIIIDDIDIKK